MGKRVTTAQIEVALRQAAGVQAAAAELLGVNRSTVCRRIAASAKLQEVVGEIEDKMLDVAESKLFMAINRGEMKSVFFYLDRKGRHRGYTKTVQVEAQKPIPIVFTPGQAELA